MSTQRIVDRDMVRGVAEEIDGAHEAMRVRIVSKNGDEAFVAHDRLRQVLRAFEVDPSLVTAEEMAAMHAGDRVTLEGGVTIEWERGS